MSMKKRLAELFFGTESQLRIENDRLERLIKTYKKQRGKAYKKLKRKYDEVLLELVSQDRYNLIYYDGSNPLSKMDQAKDYLDSNVISKIGLQDKIIDLQDKLDKATTMLQKAGIDCCKLVYTKIEEERKKEIFELSQNLISARERREDATEEQKRISKTLKELKGEQHG